jgi:hypothetical protein
MQTLDSVTLAALASDNFEYAYLCDLPANLRYTNHATDLSVGGVTYISNGLVSEFSGVSQSQAITLDSYTLQLSNVDNSIAKGYTLSNFRGQPATIYMAIIEDGEVVGVPTVIYKGTLDSFGIKETGSTSTLSLKLTSFWANYNQKGGRYTSDSIQQGLHTGDTIFKYAHEESSDSLGWGKR